MSVVSIPGDVLYLIANFLLVAKQQNKSIFQFSFDWRNFINARKESFGIWKKKSQLLVLKPAYAIAFVQYVKFRERILHLIEDPLEQIALRFFKENSKAEPLQVGIFWGYRTLQISDCSITGFPTAVNELSIAGDCNIPSWDSCPPVRKLRFQPSPKVGGNISLDVSCLQISEEAIFSSVDLLKYHMLTHLQSISVSFTESITDVSCFSNVPKLEFYRCPNITDISSLSNVRELQLSFCDGIVDVSCLGKVCKLTLEVCEHVRDVSALVNVPFLRIENCRQLENLSALKLVSRLCLQWFEEDNLSSLPPVKSLFLSKCPNLRDVTDSTSLKTLRLYNCSSISRFHGLPALEDLFIDFGSQSDQPVQLVSGHEVFSKLQRFHAKGVIFEPEEEQPNFLASFTLLLDHFSSLQSLILRRCSFTRFPEENLRHLKSLNISSCHGLSALPALPALVELWINDCSELKTLNLFAPNGNLSDLLCLVEIYGCRQLKTLIISRTVSRMQIIACSQFSELL
jgi:Leucine-rich repeat (LRR) protein